MTRTKDSKHEAFIPHSGGHHRERPDDGGAAFFPDPRNNASGNHGGDELGEMIGQNFVDSATSAQETIEDRRNELTNEELGVPYIIERGPADYRIQDDDDEIEGVSVDAFPS